MKPLVTLLALALASAALVACGGSDDNSGSTTTGGTKSSGAASGGKEEQEPSGGGESTVSFEADPGGDLAYTSDGATAEAGAVTIEFDNPQPLQHDVQIENSQGEDVGGTDLIAAESTSATVDLEPGTYTFYCSVPGHREAGMEGTLTVK